jgi:hypothetical protein
MESRARSEQTEQAEDASAAAGSSGGADRLRRRAAGAYERLASPLYGASWQSSAGNGTRAANMNASQPWPGQERAAAIYAAMLPPTALAPWGTGISIEV